MRELNVNEIEFVGGADAADGAQAVIATAGVAVAIAAAPVAIPVVAVIALGVICGVAIGVAIEN